MVYFTWSILHGRSTSVLDSLTLNFSYTETLAGADLRRYLLELYSYITYCVSEHRCLVPGHLGSVGMLMRMLTVAVIIFTARCTEQLFQSVPSGTYRKLTFWNRNHDTEFIAWDSCCLYTQPVVRGLVAGQLRPQRLPAHPLQNTKIETSHHSTLYNIKYLNFRRYIV